MKYTQRLDYARLAEVLHERGLANLDSIRELLQLSTDGGMAFCEALVTSNLVSDWDLSKVVCETFQLPFLPVDLITPNPKALEEVDRDFFSTHQLVPVDAFGQVLTVAMPALVPAEVLAQASAMTDCVVLPLVGTVESNRRWINEHMTEAPPAPPEREGGWSSMFDEADAEVQANLGGEEEGDALASTAASSGDGGLGILDDPSLDVGFETVEDDDSLELDDSLDLDLGAIEALPADDLDEGVADVGGTDASGLPTLPPMPDFNPGSREAG
ncbi:MAG: hypothetical protein AAGB93_11020 [Planctomycetota bacterium]